jgi:catechol 2,3-dioxygenase-like lactoylglutathione lyase family enzyme
MSGAFSVVFVGDKGPGVRGWIWETPVASAVRRCPLLFFLDRFVLMTNASTLAVSGVLETCLYARDLDAAASFYGGVLGLSPVSRAEGRHVFFRCGGQMVLIFNPDATADPDGTLPPHGAEGPGHVAFRVPAGDLPDWTDRLADAGVEIEKDMTWGDAGRSIYVRDPAGNSVELAVASIWPLDDESS